MSRLDRFKEAQDAGFEAALQEIRRGAKTGHWIWYVFPQIKGLGRSAAAQAYAIEDEAEAADYLRDAVLRSRLLTIATAVAEQVRGARPTPLTVLMGSEIDVLKLVSSLTLFGAVARKLARTEDAATYQSIAAIAEEILSIAARQGYPACAYTLEHLDES